MSIRIGFRFDSADAPRLRHLTLRAEQREIPDAAHTFRLAAEAASTGEPLLMECDNLEEARLIAAGFTPYGVSAPLLEALTPGG